MDLNIQDVLLEHRKNLMDIKNLSSFELQEALNVSEALIGVLGHLISGHDFYTAFGAPGDWGYRNQIGKTLAYLYTGTNMVNLGIVKTEIDAYRYKWLRSRDLDTIQKGGVFVGMTPENFVLNGDELDIAVDTAIAAEKRRGETCTI